MERTLRITRLLRGHKPSVDRQKARNALTFSQYTDVFIKQLELTRSPNTIMSYKRVLGRASKFWGNPEITDISKTMVKAYITDLQKHYKYSSLCLHFDLLRNAFRAAAEDELIPCSPMQNMRKPMCSKDAGRDNSKAYTEEQMRNILRCVEREKPEYKAIVYFMADSGCRRGEVCGLTWDCINLTTGEVEIRYNAQYFTREGVRVLAPKNGKKRKIILNAEALHVMQEWKEVQHEWCQRQKVASCNYVFNNIKGEVMNPGSLNAIFRMLGRKHGIPNFRPHRLRHSMATISIANGADVVSISQKLGHANPSITLDVYSHANEEAQRRANNVLARAIYD